MRLTIVILGVSFVAFAQDDPYQRAENLAAAREFHQAESEYRRVLETRPGDWRLRLGLARVILWDERYGEAERHFTVLLDERPGDRDALLGYAQAAYWSGDFRAAVRRYRALVAAHSDHAEARKALDDLAAATASRYEVVAAHRDDSQPYRLSTARAIVSYYSDPLTRWDLRGTAGDARGGERSLRGFGAGVAAGIPRWRLAVEAWAERFTFPDGETETIGAASLSRDLPGSNAIVARIEKIPLLTTAESVDAHPAATQYTLSWRRDPAARWLASVNVHSVDYSDGNRGAGADAWAVAPLFSSERLTLRAGLSAAWRDTDQNRFRFTSFESQPIGPGEWAYQYTGVYDPYWTPHDSREGRVIVVAEIARFRVQADVGYARDRALAFGPPVGPAPTPPFTFPLMIDRSFHPWRIGTELTIPLGPRVELRARYRHEVTTFYRANEFEASLGGRL